MKIVRLMSYVVVLSSVSFVMTGCGKKSPDEVFESRIEKRCEKYIKDDPELSAAFGRVIEDVCFCTSEEIFEKYTAEERRELEKDPKKMDGLIEGTALFCAVLEIPSLL